MRNFLSCLIILFFCQSVFAFGEADDFGVSLRAIFHDAYTNTTHYGDWRKSRAEAAADAAAFHRRYIETWRCQNKPGIFEPHPANHRPGRLYAPTENNAYRYAVEILSDTLLWRMEDCVVIESSLAKDYWFILDSKRFFEVGIQGASSTFALPTGPTLAQTITVTNAGVPVSRGVSVTLSENGVVIQKWVIFAPDGKVTIDYVPPYMRSTVVELTAECDDCIVPVTKKIMVNMCNLGTCSR